MQDIRTGTSPWMDGEDAFVRVDEVVKIFGDTVAVQSVSLDVAHHEILHCWAAQGCGKSTLLRMLAGFEEPTSGRIYLDNEDITDLPPYRRPVDMMFQSYALFPHMSVEADVAYGLKQEGVPRNEIHERVFEALDLVQMAGFARRKPSQLSGGQQQRVALARSLVKRPKLLLLDEPMSALDKQIRQNSQIELVKILERVGVTCIMVTHDQEEAMTVASRLAVMSDGQIIQSGTPYDVYSFPNSSFVAGSIGSTNLFSGVVTVDEPDHVASSPKKTTKPSPCMSATALASLWGWTVYCLRAPRTDQGRPRITQRGHKLGPRHGDPRILDGQLHSLSDSSGCRHADRGPNAQWHLGPA